MQHTDKLSLPHCTGLVTARVAVRFILSQTLTMELHLTQPLLATSPEPHHAHSDVLTLSQFLNLLTEEEDYFAGEQANTQLMITRLRKIFYDQWGWNSELIRATASVEGRYVTTIVADPEKLHVPQGHAKPVRRYKDNEYQPRHRLVTYRPDDRIYGDRRVGQVPFIYQSDHQEVLLPEGFYCDLGHVLTGLDALNHPQVVSPLPSFLFFLAHLLPHVESNADVATWLGDLGSSAGDFLFCYLKTNRKPLSVEQEQKFINLDTPGSDMLGNIDAYVIAHHYTVNTTNGPRLTAVLADYYDPQQPGSRFRAHRFSTFCQIMGLRGWNGDTFANEGEWLGQYRWQLRNDTCFQLFSLTEETLKSIWLMLRVWFNGYQPVLKLEVLLELYLNALKECIKQEPPR